MTNTLERNRLFAEADGHVGVGIFPELRLLVVACLDPRVDPAHVLGLNLGDAMVIRNAGGRVTPEVIANIAFVSQLAERVVQEGPLFEVAVMHHTQCGAASLANDDFRETYATRIGVEQEELVRYAVVDPAVSVACDVGLLRASQAISPRITVSGHVYDVSSGLVETVIPATLERSA
ncbi:MAG TPA: carbonic anhydrase [Gaiellaceae bacterium]|nr:carbonic anhydrase [Gaiellaceae bacterium]